MYFENIVYQVFSENLNLILYKNKGLWQSNIRNADEALINKIGAAIAEQTGE